jgi:integrase
MSENRRRPAGSEQVGDFVSIFLRGRTWYANYQHEGKQFRPSLKTTNKKEALSRARKIENQLQEGRFQAPVRPVTIGEAKDLYLGHLNALDKSPKTLGKYAYILGKLEEVAKAIGVTKLKDVNLRVLDKYKAARAANQARWKPKTRHVELTIIKSFTNFACRRDLLQKNPLDRLENPKSPGTPQPCWDWEEVQNVLGACPDTHRPAAAILAYTGMRFGEMAWLTWDDIDFQAELVYIRPKLGWRIKRGDQRAVPIPPDLRKVLESLPRVARWVVTRPPSRTYSRGDRQWQQKPFYRVLKTRIRRLGLKGHPHTFRHAFISDALMRGVPPAIVRKWVGHIDQRILDHYTHIHSRASHQEMRRLNEARNAGRTDPKGSQQERSDETDNKEGGQTAA